MKKYVAPAIAMVLVIAAILVRYAIVAPARGAARDLEAINGITVGKTTEADLLGRRTFQKMDEQCSLGDCLYHAERSNDFLTKLGLAPHTFMGTMVRVREGMVTQVATYISTGTRPTLSFSQKEQLPAGCASSPCVKPVLVPTGVMVSVMIAFNNESEMRNRMPGAIDTTCLSRLHGCRTYVEVTPLARELNLEQVAALK